MAQSLKPPAERVSLEFASPTTSEPVQDYGFTFADLEPIEEEEETEEVKFEEIVKVRDRTGKMVELPKYDNNGKKIYRPTYNEDGIEVGTQVIKKQANTNQGWALENPTPKQLIKLIEVRGLDWLYNPKNEMMILENFRRTPKK